MDLMAINNNSNSLIYLNNNCIDTEDNADVIASLLRSLTEKRFNFSNQRICSNWTGNDVTVVFS